jgi:ABC-2 type transport system permease protein
VSQPATLPWLAGHELRLGWRDWAALMTAGRRRRARNVAIAILIAAAVMHLFAWWIVKGYADANVAYDAATLVGVTGTLLLSWSLLLSQAMESVTRAFYARSDLDLILTSPVSARKVFAVRMGRIAAASVAVALLLAAPFIDVLALRGGLRWLAAYGVVAAMGAVATAAALALTIALFRLVGAKRTRLIAQIVAAVIGAAFVIGLQIAAIFSFGTLSRFAALQSQWMLARAPDPASVFWWPARAVLGDLGALAGVVAVGFALLGVAIALFSRRFGEHTLAAAGVGSAVVRRRRAALAFRPRSQARVLRHKEWTLLQRDPWLMSQTLMQLLYLVPPALFLWRSFSDSSTALVLITPMIVMAAGQLAGGLAWLTISGEDAADLVATAPLSPSRVIRAKIEVVLISICVLFTPLVAALAILAPLQAAVTAFTVMIAAGSATAIQLWFRVQAKRSQFRRRQTSSRIATFAEAFCSIGWAATSALVLMAPIAAIVTALMTVGIIATTWKLSPLRE